jgi:exodeoxyribonuclease VII small subunit
MRAKKDPVATESAAPDEEPNPTFEEALERLETIVENLENGSLTLEESIARYEEGIRLSRRLTQTLDEAEKRIERLVETEAGPITEPIELEAEGSEAGGSSEPPARPARERGTPPAAPQRTGTRGAGQAPDPEELPF